MDKTEKAILGLGLLAAGMRFLGADGLEQVQKILAKPGGAAPPPASSPPFVYRKFGPFRWVSWEKDAS